MSNETFVKPFHGVHKARIGYQPQFRTRLKDSLPVGSRAVLEHSLRTVFAATISVIALLTLCSCAGSVDPPITVSVTNTFSSIQVGDKPVTLTATITPGSTAGIKWLLTLANAPCSPACGTLVVAANTLSAVYTPPKSAPLNQNATITAADAANASAEYVFNFVIIPAVGVVITDKFPSQVVTAPPVSLSADVTNDAAAAGVTWTLTADGTACAPACGTLISPPAPTTTATYTPPTTLPAGANASPTITATSVTQPSSTDSFSFSIVSAATLLPKGSYAFLLRGYDSSGLPLVAVGSITSDGNGNLTNGEIDIDGDGGILHVPAPIAGNYSIDESFNGQIRGTFTITSFTFPNTKVNISMKFTLSADGSHGTIVEFDGSGYLCSGTIVQQDSAALTAANPAGTYAFGLDSNGPVGGRIVEAGQIVIGNAGVTGGVADQSQAGGAAPTYVAAPITGGPFTAPDSSGRGTMTVTIAGNATKYAYYIVSSSQLNIVEIDQGLKFGTVQAGTAQIQQLPFTSSSVNTTASVLQITGMDIVPGTNIVEPDVIVGVMSISEGTNFSLTFDANDEGDIKPTHTISGTVTFDPSTARGVASVVGGFNTGFIEHAVFYTYDVGKGYMIDGDSYQNIPPANSITNNGFSGTFTSQAAGLTAQSISGGVVSVFNGAAAPDPSGGTLTTDLPYVAATFNFANMNGTFTGVGALTSFTTGFTEVANSNLGLDGSFSIVDTVVGRGTANVPTAVFGHYPAFQAISATFYMIAPNSFVLIGTQQGVYSGVALFEPN